MILENKSIAKPSRMPSASHCLFATFLILIGGMVCASAQPRLIAWGDFSVGTNVPVGLPDLKSISAGFSHGLALRSNGLVVAWGDNSLGQASVPSNLSNVTAVAAGQYHSLALRSNGTVVAWGLNNFGQSTVPTSLTNIIAIAAGSLHSLALRS